MGRKSRVAFAFILCIDANTLDANTLDANGVDVIWVSAITAL